MDLKKVFDFLERDKNILELIYHYQTEIKNISDEASLENKSTKYIGEILNILLKEGMLNTHDVRRLKIYFGIVSPTHYELFYGASFFEEELELADKLNKLISFIEDEE
ncbi:MAG: hypothetical protein [Caudoviricetes sp.]|nr:MAG: hypothetical protein [Caudoviricetes sp.]